MILGLTAIASLFFIGTLFYQALSSVLEVSKFNWGNFNITLGYGIVGITVVRARKAHLSELSDVAL